MVIPTLHTGANSILRDPEAIAAYIVRHTVFNPGRTSELIEKDLISLLSMTAEYGNDLEQLAHTYASRLEFAISNAINSSVEVNVSVIPFSDANYRDHLTSESIDTINRIGTEIQHGKMSLKISVVDKRTGKLLIGDATVSSDGKNFSIDFK